MKTAILEDGWASAAQRILKLILLGVNVSPFARRKSGYGVSVKPVTRDWRSSVS
jgi:hypothetical protein